MSVQADLFPEQKNARVSGHDAHHFALPDADIFSIERFIPQPAVAFAALFEEVAWRQDTIMMYGRPVLIPRLNAWYGEPEAKYAYSGLQLAPLAWTPTLQQIRREVENCLELSFNSALVNLYRDGNDSVAWHSDDEKELGPEPVIASVSLGAERRFSLRHRRDSSIPVQHIPLRAGSLLVMRGPTQRHWHHQVAKDKTVRDGRINITFRQIRRQ